MSGICVFVAFDGSAPTGAAARAEAAAIFCGSARETESGRSIENEDITRRSISSGSRTTVPPGIWFPSHGRLTTITRRERSLNVSIGILASVHPMVKDHRRVV
jgi:hypothetical protein